MLYLLGPNYSIKGTGYRLLSFVVIALFTSTFECQETYLFKMYFGSDIIIIIIIIIIINIIIIVVVVVVVVVVSTILNN